MDEKIKEGFEKFCAELTDEQKEKLQKCKSLDELMELLGKEGIEIPDELLTGVAGGTVSADSLDSIERTLRSSGLSAETIGYLMWRWRSSQA